MILLIDNYDSFSYNLYQLIGTLDPHIRTIRNDELSVEEIAELAPTHIFISPGPGKPEDAGICINVVKHFRGLIPILGVCLGHQAICCAYGATVAHAPRLMHGKSSLANLSHEGVFSGIPSPLTVARYHSLAVVEDTLPPDLTVTARTDMDEVMAVEDFGRHVVGLQFHPESILTEHGKDIVKNFLKGAR
ncbi:MAG: aminodeoxychorismate/anthranilate synthase component II [Spirochaetia bacterium]|nr:aminodeoxychorismate/anthranilate synthase component II [Spirochaetia bacterium]